MNKIFKKTLGAAVALLIPIFSMSSVNGSINISDNYVSAAELSYGSLTYEIMEDGNIAITECDKSVTEVNIPSEIDGKKVTAIANSAFYWCDKLTALKIPDTVEILDSNAFYSCKALKDLDLGSGVKYIGSQTFAYCDSLTTLTIPQNVTYLDTGAFQSCISLTDVTINNGCEYIGEDAFLDCSALTTINFGNAVEYIGSMAFYRCSSLLSVEFPESLICIDRAAFSECTSLTSAKLPEGLLYIESAAFSQSALKSVNIPSTVISIGADAFDRTPVVSEIEQGPVIVDGWVLDYNGRAINDNKELVLDESVHGIADHALYGCEMSSLTATGLLYIGNEGVGNCSDLTTFNVGNNLLTVGDDAFNNCEKLDEIKLPDSVVYIGDSAFKGTGYYDNLEDGIIYLGGWAVDYKGEIPENTVLVVTDGTYGIADNTFAFKTGLKGIKLPDSLTVIGNNSFKGCNSLDSVKFPDNLIEVGSEAFLDCENLKSVTLPNALKFIGDYAFGFTFDTYEQSYKPIEGFTISGYQGSAAETYAKENGFTFINMGTITLILGDVNCNGKVEINDAVLLKKHLVNTQMLLDNQQYTAADVNQDGKINVFDLIILKRMLTA